MTTRRRLTINADVPDGAALPERTSLAAWSVDRERRRLDAEIEERRRITESPIYPREIAEKIAHDAARSVIPDWRLVRDEHRALFVQLLRDRPELQQREVRHFDSLVNLIRDQLPTAMQPLLADLHTIFTLKLLAHESAAFFVGVETGRQLEHQHVDAHGRLRGYRKSPATTADKALRLHLANDRKRPRARAPRDPITP